MPLNLVPHKQKEGPQLQISHIGEDTCYHFLADIITHDIMQKQLAKQAMFIKVTGATNLKKSLG